jgi:hypothetical protein
VVVGSFAILLGSLHLGVSENFGIFLCPFQYPKKSIYPKTYAPLPTGKDVEKKNGLTHGMEWGSEF